MTFDYPVCLQLAKAGGHAFAERSFKRKRACDVCGLNIDNPGAFCKGESTSHVSVRSGSRPGDTAERRKYTPRPDRDDRPLSVSLKADCQSKSCASPLFSPHCVQSARLQFTRHVKLR